jgi:hypothetical protein
VFAAGAAAEKRQEGGGEMMRAGRDRVAAVIALGVGLLGVVAAVRAFDGFVVIGAHVFVFLCVGTRRT